MDLWQIETSQARPWRAEVFKNFKQKVMSVLPPASEHQVIDSWFQEEARFGQQNTISRLWAPTGSRPGLIRQQQFK